MSGEVQVDVMDSPGFLLNQATGAERIAGPGFGALGLTGAQWTVIYLLHEQRAQTAAQIARALGTDVAATWRLVGRLTDKGYITRSNDPIDRRQIKLGLTENATANYPCWRAMVAGTLSLLLEDVPTDRLTVLTQALVQIIVNARPPVDTPA